MNAEPVVVLWPLAATMAVVGAGRVRASRRRVALNRALHELRRPLTALALSPGAGPQGREPSALALALAALEDLDAAINGRTHVTARRPVAARPLVAGAIARWERLAAARDRRIEFLWEAGGAAVIADPARVSQALDNLLANAIEHSSGRIRVIGTGTPRRLAIEVASARPAPASERRDSRRGHGLDIVRSVAAAHEGRFRLRRAGGEVAAVLELPLAVPAPA
ncbi:MAG: sensor histidine kinase [Solirubrobacterales bacterium]